MLLLIAGGASGLAPAGRYLSFAEARPVLAALSEGLPPELKALTDAEREAVWPAWIERHDHQIRERLARGDEDTLVNWLLLGTSFTAEPPAVAGSVPGNGSDEILRRTVELIQRRVGNLVEALVAPGDDERRLFARDLLERQGFRFDSIGARDAVADHLTTAVVRVLEGQEQFARDLEAADRANDPAAVSALRARLFRARGLSLDTSLFPNYALEQSLAVLRERGLLKPGAVARVAIVGPGLDFSDKDTGFDFYPQQTLQPFAVLDSLRRLDLTPPSADVEIVLLDISPRVIDHITRARARAAKGDGYTLHLPLARDREWLPEARRYWKMFGDHVGAPADVGGSPPASERAEVRAVRVPRSVVRRNSVVDLNVVTQRFDGQGFDLVIATNVFLYYDLVDQILAMANIEAMLNPSGLFLANYTPATAQELSALRIRQVGSLVTLYSRTGAGDRGPGENTPRGTEIFWYQAPVGPGPASQR